MISIIIPVYNVSAYLDECLMSIAAQKIIDWECILVDDGSKDDSGGICDRWMQKDSRFKVIHQQNQGVSVARNCGILKAKGEYICFVDSDDWVEVNYLGHLLENIGDSELVVAGLVHDYPNNRHIEFVPNESRTITYNLEHIDEFVDINKKFLLYGPVQKLYRKDIILNYKIFFPINCDFGEDLQFNYSYLEHVKEISLVSKCDYHYRIFGAGTLSSKFRPDQFAQDYKQWLLLKDFYFRHNLWVEAAKELLYDRLWGVIYDSIFIYPKLTGKGIDYLKEVLSVPEISELCNYRFSCSKWIRWAILHRNAYFFYLFFKFKK